MSKDGIGMITAQSTPHCEAAVMAMEASSWRQSLLAHNVAMLTREGLGRLPSDKLIRAYFIYMEFSSWMRACI